METITLHSRVGTDGLLKLQVPVKATNTELEVVLIVQPVAPTGQEHGWPPGFFETTYGSFRDQPLVREPQGEYEIRDELDPPENTASPDARPLGRTI
jgi:hypothetical protein